MILNGRSQLNLQAILSSLYKIFKDLTPSFNTATFTTAFKVQGDMIRIHVLVHPAGALCLLRRLTTGLPDDQLENARALRWRLGCLFNNANSLIQNAQIHLAIEPPRLVRSSHFI